MKMKNIILYFCLFLFCGACTLDKLHEDEEMQPSNPPIADFEIVNNNCGAPCEVSFIDNSENAVSFFWTFGDGNNSMEQEPSYTYNLTGSFPVKLIVENSNQEIDSVTKVVNIFDPDCPVLANFDVMNDGCTAPCLISFSSTPSINAESFLWDFGDGTVSTDVFPEHTFQLGGIHQITLTATGGGCSNVTSKLIDINYTTFEKTFGSTENEIGYSIFETSDFGLVFAGEGSLEPSEGSGDVNIMKTDLEGNELWRRIHGTHREEAAFSMTPTVDDGYAIVGSISPPMSPGNNKDVYFLKTDNFGDTIWTKYYGESDGGNKVEIGKSVQETSDGGYIILGEKKGQGTGNGVDLYLIKTNSTGDTLWTKIFPMNGEEEAAGVIQTSDNAYVILGHSDNGEIGGSDFYLVKINETGTTILWDHFWGTSADDLAYSIISITDGGFALIGASNQAGNNMVYLIITDAMGGGIEEYFFGGNQDNIGYAIKQTSDGGFIITGSTQSMGGGDTDAYLLKIDNIKELEWENTFGGTSIDVGYDVIQTADGGYAIIGKTESFGVGGSDFYLIKTNPDGEVD